MDRIITYFQENPLFFWTLAVLAAAMAVLGVLLIVRTVRHGNRPQPDSPQKDTDDETSRL